MGQHYTQSTASRNLNIPAIARLTHAQAFELLTQIRFADNGGVPYCPKCLEGRRVRWRSDKRWFCGSCRGTFSLTTNTVWAHNLNALPHLFLMLAHFVTNASGDAHIQIARRTFGDPKSTYYFLMKVREAMLLRMNSEILTDKVEVDSCFMGGYKRKLNDREEELRLKRTGAWKLPPKKILCAVRMRHGPVLARVVSHERDFVSVMLEKVAADTTVYADMAGAWERLGETFPVRYINHSEYYWTPSASTQHVEAFFRRMRRAERLYGHVAGDHLDLYAAEIAFRESNCRKSDAEKFLALINLCLHHPISKRFAGAYQRSKLK